MLRAAAWGAHAPCHACTVCHPELSLPRVPTRGAGASQPDSCQKSAQWRCLLTWRDHLRSLHAPRPLSRGVRSRARGRRRAVRGRTRICKVQLRSAVAPMAAEARASSASAAHAAPTMCTATQRAAAAAACWSALPPPQADAPRSRTGSHAAASASAARLAAALRAPPTQLAACSAAEPRAVWKVRPMRRRKRSAPPPLVARPAPRPLPRPTLTRACRARRAS